jgi:hypothetical protein
MIIPSLLLAAAAVAAVAPLDKAAALAMYEKIKARVSPKMLVAATLAAAAIALWPMNRSSDVPTPAPDSGPIALRGIFTGETASEDAATIGSLLSELADEIEWDGMQAEPSIKTGVHIDQLRRAARILRCKGESIGERQPAARDRIAEYLEKQVGTDGGQLTPAARSAWVAAFRDIGRAANDAAQ